MEQAKEVIWSSSAENSLNAILDYYFELTTNSKYGDSLIEKINQIVLNITRFNFLGKQTHMPNLRVVFFNHFELFYQISGDIIYISLIWDSRRNPEELKKLL